MWLASLYVLAGLGVGALIGFTGIGGGSVMTPLLMLGFGLPPSVAVGTDLAFAAVTRLIASAASPQPGAIDWAVVRRLLSGSVPAAALVLLVLWLAPTEAVSADRVVRGALVLMLVLTALSIALQSVAQRLGLRLTAAALVRVERLRPAATIAAGVLVGAAVTLTSVGSGALMVTLLALLYPLRLSGARLVATDLAHALPLTVLAAVGYAALGHLDFAALGLLLTGAVPGALLAQRTRVPAFLRALRPLLALVVLGGAAWLLG
jgi:hypothetical protein